ncbi:TPA: hypothetical protein VDB83_004907 [Burkholderia cenocepacia]|nr:hypothetical protein [Burkholderia cenocepacia]
MSQPTNVRQGTSAPATQKDDDFISHYGSWREAMIIARDHARVAPPDVDERTYWDREIRVYDEAFSGYSALAIPDDFRTHHKSWREALVIARDRAIVQLPDVDDRAYWEHELAAYDRAFASIGITPTGDVPAWTSEDCAIADKQGWNLFDVDGSGYLEIQRDDEAQVFESDDDALAYVREQAQGGCPVALKAMGIAKLHAQSVEIVGRRLSDVSLEPSMPAESNAPIVTLPDGYNGHTMRFGADPIEINGETVKLRCAEPGKEYMIAWRSADALRDAIESQEDARGANRDWIREVAANVLKGYAGVERVANLYDSDQKFSGALGDLAGTDFEYPDFAHLSVAEAVKKATRLGGPIRHINAPHDLRDAPSASGAGAVPQAVSETDIASARAAGFAVYVGAADYVDAALRGRCWWTVTRPGWSGIEASQGDFATESEAWADAVRTLRGDPALQADANVDVQNPPEGDRAPSIAQMRDQPNLVHRIAGTVLGHGLPDWPEDLATFEERRAYQRGVAHARYVDKSVGLTELDAQERGSRASISDKPLRQRLAEMTAEQAERGDWAIVHKTLVDCQKQLEAGGARLSWIDPAVAIARSRATTAVKELSDMQESASPSLDM